MNQAILDKIESEQFRKDNAKFNVGDSVRVHTKVVEGDKERIQIFAGVVIGRRGRGLNSTFTVRRISYGEGVERVFPVHSPRVEKIEVERQGEVRRAKLTYLRKRLGKDDWCVSVFADNAGVVNFDDKFHVCFKVETHNHPSAIEPYGGANTGIGGVIRDPLGTGLGAKPIANTDVASPSPKSARQVEAMLTSMVPNASAAIPLAASASTSRSQ